MLVTDFSSARLKVSRSCHRIVRHKSHTLARFSRIFRAPFSAKWHYQILVIHNAEKIRLSMRDAPRCLGFLCATLEATSSKRLRIRLLVGGLHFKFFS